MTATEVGLSFVVLLASIPAALWLWDRLVP